MLSTALMPSPKNTYCPRISSSRSSPSIRGIFESSCLEKRETKLSFCRLTCNTLGLSIYDQNMHTGNSTIRNRCLSVQALSQISAQPWKWSRFSHQRQSNITCLSIFRHLRRRRHVVLWKRRSLWLESCEV